MPAHGLALSDPAQGVCFSLLAHGLDLFVLAEQGWAQPVTRSRLKTELAVTSARYCSCMVSLVLRTNGNTIQLTLAC